MALFSDTVLFFLALAIASLLIGGCSSTSLGLAWLGLGFIDQLLYQLLYFILCHLCTIYVLIYLYILQYSHKIIQKRAQSCQNTKSQETSKR
jgi:hypothetical protein